MVAIVKTDLGVDGYKEAISFLIEKLKEIDCIANEYWMKTLDKRKVKELEFHDKHRDRASVTDIDQDTFEKFYGNKKYYEATERSRGYLREWIRKVAKNKIFLDYACGDGAQAILAAKAGASLSIGIDISRVSIENARRDAKEAGVSGNTFFVQADAENTLLPSNSIDHIICSGMLHHLDLSCAFPELKRILKPGGCILAAEALNYNPAIKLYRMLTPNMRTEWEKRHILSFKDIRFAKQFFDIGEIRFWHITGILSPHLPKFASVLQSIDALLERIPGINRLAWIFTFELVKPQ